VADAGQSWGLSEEVIEIAQLATSELVSNSVEHALSAVEITMELEQASLRIAVRDYSIAMPVHRSPDQAGARGRGVALVNALAREWGVESHEDGKTVWLVLATGSRGTPNGRGPSVLEGSQVVEVPKKVAE
jgi:anti-sigma regulatory factor (Ser/Thr protein kinase)